MGLLSYVLAAIGATVVHAAPNGAAVGDGPRANGAVEVVVKSYFELQSQGACAAFVDLFADAFEVRDPHDTPAVTSKSALEQACESSNATFSEVDLRATAIYPLFSGDGAAAAWHCGSVTRDRGCALDFAGVDTFAFDGDLRITKVDGFFDVSVPEAQMRC